MLGAKVTQPGSPVWASGMRSPSASAQAAFIPNLKPTVHLGFGELREGVQPALFKKVIWQVQDEAVMS